MADRRAGAPARDRELRARGQRTLERLLDAGASVFAARGYHAARVDDVVKAAKTSHGTFYLYFSSKEDLFQALALDVAESMVELARDLPDLTPDGAGDLHDWLARFQALYEQHSAVIRTWTEAEIVDSDMGRVGGDLVVQFSRELAKRLEAAAPHIDPEIAALAFVGMIERSNYYVESKQLPVAGSEMADTLARVIHAGIFASEVKPQPRQLAAMLATTSVQIDEITCSAKKSSDVLYDLVLNAAPPRPGWPCAEIALGA